MSTTKEDQADLRELVLNKEKELHYLYNLNLSKLEQQLNQKENEERESRQRFLTLQEDFLYNLKLLEERDKEIERLEESVVRLGSQVNEKDNTIKELASKLDGRNAEVTNLRSLLKEEETRHQLSFEELRNEKESMLQTQAIAIEDLRTSHQREKTDLQSRIHSLTTRMEQEKKHFEDHTKRISELRNQEVARFTEQVQRLTDENERHQQTILDYEKTCSNQSIKIRETEKELGELQKTHAAKVKEFSKTMKTKNLIIADLENTASQLNEALKMKETQHSEQAHTQNEELAELKSSLERANEKLTVELESQRSKTDLQTEKARHFEQAAKDLHEQNKTLSHQLDKKDHELSRLRVDLEKTESRLASLDQIMQQHESIIDELRERLIQTDREKEEAWRECRELDEQWRLQTVEERKGWDMSMARLKEQFDEDSKIKFREVVAQRDKAEAKLRVLEVRFESMFPERAHQFSRPHSTLSQPRPSTVAHANPSMYPTVPTTQPIVQPHQPEPQQNPSDAVPFHLPSHGATNPHYIQEENLQLRHTIERLHQQNEELTQIIHNMRVDMETLQTTLTAQAIDPAVVSNLQETNNIVKSKLRKTVVDLEKMVKERNKLLDMSNTLRAELRMMEEEREVEKAKSVRARFVTLDVACQTGESTDRKSLYGTARSRVVSKPTSSMSGGASSKVTPRSRSTDPAATRKKSSLSEADKTGVYKKAVEIMRSKGVRNWNDMRDL